MQRFFRSFSRAVAPTGRRDIAKREAARAARKSQEQKESVSAGFPRASLSLVASLDAAANRTERRAARLCPFRSLEIVSCYTLGRNLYVLLAVNGCE